MITSLENICFCRRLQHARGIGSMTEFGCLRGSVHQLKEAHGGSEHLVLDLEIGGKYAYGACLSSTTMQPHFDRTACNLGHAFNFWDSVFDSEGLTII